MELMLIDINDHEVTLIQQHHCITQSGYALVNGCEILFGGQAWQQSKSLPLHSFCHYWQRLGYESISTTNDKVNHFADLAFLQLQQLVDQLPQSEHVILLVPAHYNNDQLQLLLGIAKACGLIVRAIINNAVAKLWPRCNESIYSYLDIELHQAYCSELTVDSELKLAKHDVFLHQGVHDLFKELAIWLNQRFIQECRFDAFHTAQTEQMLYQCLPDLLQQVEAQYTITINDKSLVVTVKELREKITAFFQPTFNTLATSNHYYISRRFAKLIANLTINSQQDFIIVEDNDLYNNIIELFDDIITGNDICLLKQLPLKPAPLKQLKQLQKERTHLSRTSQDALNETDNITHVLYLGHAYLLTQQKIYLNANNDKVLSQQKTENSLLSLAKVNQGWQIAELNHDSICINQNKVNVDQQLQCADTIEINDSKLIFTLIHVEEQEK